jgi:predicted kinase
VASQLRSAQSWLDERGSGAPAALLERARYYLAQVEPSSDPADDLARAGLVALDATVGSPGDRRAALDLLAADGLVTLALLVRAETEPAALADFAARIRNAGVTTL